MYHSNILTKILVTITASLFTFGIVGIAVAYAAQPQYVALAPIDIGTPVRTDLGGFVIDVFRIAIAFSAALAVLMILIGGFQYMSTDAITGRKEGKKRIQEALYGLALVVLTFLILQTINPRIVDIGLITGDTQSAQQNGSADQKVIPQGRAGEVGNTPLQQYSFKASSGKRYTVTGLKTEDLNTLGDGDFYSITFIKSSTKYFTDTEAQCKAYDQTHLTTPCHEESNTVYWLMCNGASWCTNGQRATSDDFASQASCTTRANAEPGLLTCSQHVYKYSLSVNNGSQVENNLTSGACSYYKQTWATNNPGQTTSDCVKTPLK